MTFDHVAEVEKVKAKFPDAVLEVQTDLGDAVVVIDGSKLGAVAKWLASEGGYSFLSSLTGVDHLGRLPRFEVVYELLDMTAKGRLRLRAMVPDSDDPSLPSVTQIWPTADWHERETFDMFGISFEGHPSLTRILMPDEWEGHPLRKDYAVGKVPVEYKHLSPGL